MVAYYSAVAIEPILRLEFSQTPCGQSNPYDDSSRLQEFLEVCGLLQWEQYFVENMSVSKPRHVQAITAVDLRKLAKDTDMALDADTIRQVLSAIQKGQLVGSTRGRRCPTRS